MWPKWVQLATTILLVITLIMVAWQFHNFHEWVVCLPCCDKRKGSCKDGDSKHGCLDDAQRIFNACLTQALLLPAGTARDAATAACTASLVANRAACGA